MMQTLRLLGVPIIGMDFHRDFSNRELNPQGYWDLPIEETINGIQHPTYQGHAVKLFGLQLSRTPAKYVNKVIVCVRDREATLPSIRRLIESEMWQLARLGISPCDRDCERTYDENYAIISGFLGASGKPNLFVRYEDMLESTELEICRIAGFVESKANIEQAVENVRR
jgi:hypothetical protein